MASPLRRLERTIIRNRDGGQGVGSYYAKRHDAIVAWYNENGDLLKLPKRRDKSFGKRKRRHDGKFSNVGQLRGYLNWFSRIGEAFANYRKMNSPSRYF